MRIDRVNLDRFAQGLPDPQVKRLKAWATCEACGEGIYPGDYYYDTSFGLCCDDELCLAEVTGVLRKEHSCNH